MALYVIMYMWMWGGKWEANKKLYHLNTFKFPYWGFLQVPLSFSVFFFRQQQWKLVPSPLASFTAHTSFPIWRNRFIRTFISFLSVNIFHAREFQFRYVAFCSSLALHRAVSRKQSKIYPILICRCHVSNVSTCGRTEYSSQRKMMQNFEFPWNLISCCLILFPFIFSSNKKRRK